MFLFSPCVFSGIFLLKDNSFLKNFSLKGCEFYDDTKKNLFLGQVLAKKCWRKSVCESYCLQTLLQLQSLHFFTMPISIVIRNYDPSWLHTLVPTAVEVTLRKNKIQFHFANEVVSRQNHKKETLLNEVKARMRIFPVKQCDDWLKQFVCLTYMSSWKCTQ